MLACHFDGRRVRVDTGYPEPAVPPGEVAVAVRLAGVCRTDLEIIKGYMQFRGVLGHEFVGTALGGALEGRRVVGGINCVCGACDLCRRGLPTHCRRRTVLGIDRRDGAFAQRLVLPEANLVPVPDGVPDRDAVFAEPLAAAIQIGRQVDLAPGQRIVLLGDGRLGQLVARVFRAWGLAPTVVGKSPAKLDLVRRLGLEAMTVDQVDDTRRETDVPRPDVPGDAARGGCGDPPRGKVPLDVPRPDVPGDAARGGCGDPPRGKVPLDVPRPALPGRALRQTADVVVEATGTADGLAMALAFVRPRGTIVLKSTVADTAGLDLAPLVVNEVTVVGSRCGPMDEAVAMLAAGGLDLEPLVTAEYPLAEAETALAAAAEADAIKVLIRP